MGHRFTVVALVLAAAPLAAQRPERAPSRLERALLAELNQVRRDPHGYAARLEPMMRRFTRNVYERPEDSAYIVTKEGPAAVREAIAVLRDTHPRRAVTRVSGLALAAADHVIDQGRTGALGHAGSDGSTPARRAERYGRWTGRITESIAYGPEAAREVIQGLLIDDGVPGRGHRVNLLDSLVTVGGAACGPHREYGHMCVIVLAGGFVSAGAKPRQR